MLDAITDITEDATAVPEDTTPVVEGEEITTKMIQKKMSPMTKNLMKMTQKKMTQKSN